MGALLYPKKLHPNQFTRLRATIPQTEKTPLFLRWGLNTDIIVTFNPTTYRHKRSKSKRSEAASSNLGDAARPGHHDQERPPQRGGHEVPGTFIC